MTDNPPRVPIDIDSTAADAAIAALMLDVLRAYLNIRPAGEPARVDWAVAGRVGGAVDAWEPAVVLGPDLGGDPASQPERAVIRLDDGGRQVVADLHDLRPHRPCHGNGSGREHPAEDPRFCQPGHVGGLQPADLTGPSR